MSFRVNPHPIVRLNVKVLLPQSGSYIDSLDWIKNKKATINPIKMIMFPKLFDNWIKPSRNLKRPIKNNKN